MSRETLNLRQAAEHVHLSVNELRHFAQRGEIDATERGGDWYFEHRSLDEWAQRNLLSASDRTLSEQHKVMMAEERRAHHENWGVAGFISPQAILLGLPSKTKAGLIRDMSDLAVRTGLVYDEDGLFRELLSREEAASTAIGGGVALLHPRFHDPYFFEASFIAYGRSERPIFFGAPDGEPTRHFFLVCSTDHEEHLHILARLAMLARNTNMIRTLEEALVEADILKIVASCELELRS